MADDCSDVPPISGVFLQGISTTEKAFIGISTFLCLAVLLLFADKVYFIHRHYGNRGHHKLIKHRSLLLVAIYPVTAVASLLAVYVPRSVLLCDLISSVYLAVCLYQFTDLIVLYFGGIPALLERTSVSGFVLRGPPCCCCCCCCPTVASSKQNLTRLQLLVLQAAFVQPVVAFISLTLWVDDKYVPKVTTVDSPSLYLSTVSSVSTLLAIYGLLVLFRASKAQLATHSISPKFLVLQLVLIVQNLQRLVFDILGDDGVPPCLGSLGSGVRAHAIHHMLAIAEMFLLACVARLIYRKPIRQEMAEEFKSSSAYDEMITGDWTPVDSNSLASCDGGTVEEGRAVEGDGLKNSGRGVQSYHSVDTIPGNVTSRSADGSSQAS